ncbi:hypothetical protein P3342_009604 [Pyrenophora teres f. teres]|uniref:Uncharacterized protein n=2 Tax=Pyrenophora teres f. teres TaxID=97479 RepID=E3RF01_PYRTT|nr:hypothetical protein PTT_05423 [Pyrenophora teres f. teres 0-1]KAE8834755.1 hypothetical protein PTNB85_06088 [Pyrenophora teres f. teres]KAE8843767.1 hypothetical protein HRS9122_04870 [Pyrenophora teres f. teres]KAE8859175.1 hypothetical protein PTNB73_08655 [Pyrenophora teres f. teres]KAE8861041.1 hypothetical protein PTNB29_06136 [Pyrenophora teres f. teres]
MPRHRRRNAIETKDQNLYPLLHVLKADFGIDWGVYQEFLDGAKAAIVAGESYSASAEEIELLIRNPAARIAHEGVLLLLRETGVKEREEALLKFHINTSADTDISTDNMAPPLPTPESTPPRFTAPVVARNHTNDRVSMPPPTVKNPAHPTQTGPTYRKIERPTNTEAVLFSDPIFKLDVQNFFGFTNSSNNNNNMNNGAQINRTRSQRALAEPRSAPPYRAADDDLAVWRKRLEVEHGVKDDQAQGDTKGLKTTEDLQQDMNLAGLRRKSG